MSKKEAAPCPPCGAYSGDLSCGCCGGVQWKCEMPHGHDGPHTATDDDAYVKYAHHERISMTVRWWVPTALQGER